MANIMSGLIDIALVVAAEKIDFPGRENVLPVLNCYEHEAYGLISDIVGPSISALYATRHMYEFGTTENRCSGCRKKSDIRCRQSICSILQTADYRGRGNGFSLCGAPTETPGGKSDF